MANRPQRTILYNVDSILAAAMVIGKAGKEELIAGKENAKHYVSDKGAEYLFWCDIVDGWSEIHVEQLQTKTYSMT